MTHHVVKEHRGQVRIDQGDGGAALLAFHGLGIFL